MTEQQISKGLAEALEVLLMQVTHGYNTMPRSKDKRDAVEEGMAALETYKKAPRTVAHKQEGIQAEFNRYMSGD